MLKTCHINIHCYVRFMYPFHCQRFYTLMITADMDFLVNLFLLVTSISQATSFEWGPKLKPIIALDNTNGFGRQFEGIGGISGGGVRLFFPLNPSLVICQHDFIILFLKTITTNTSSLLKVSIV